MANIGLVTIHSDNVIHTNFLEFISRIIAYDVGWKVIFRVTVKMVGKVGAHKEKEKVNGEEKSFAT